MSLNYRFCQFFHQHEALQLGSMQFEFIPAIERTFTISIFCFPTKSLISHLQRPFFLFQLFEMLHFDPQEFCYGSSMRFDT